MLMDKDIALQVSNIMIELSSKLNQSIVLVQNNCSNEDFEAYRQKAGYIMGTIYTDIMLPIYKRYPEIEPNELKD